MAAELLFYIFVWGVYRIIEANKDLQNLNIISAQITFCSNIAI